MKLENSILEKLIEKIDLLDTNNVTIYSIINNLKDIYVSIVENGYVSDDVYLDLASFVLYIGFLMEE